MPKKKKKMNARQLAASRLVKVANEPKKQEKRGY